ncbi:MAG: hypothetical protein J3K34DRAFT_502704 [Monoraphidium minutum]|nr:MAG: hypothetical protein J3K34DRAFT_502704 [Monoraphidium minutum]
MPALVQAQQPGCDSPDTAPCGGGPAAPRSAAAAPRAGGSASSLDSPFWRDDATRMAYLKVLPCPCRTPHRWASCPFAHPGEKVRRRALGSHEYSGDMCPLARQGRACPDGDACRFSHNVFEQWLHPANYKTKMCADGAACSRHVCFFAHDPSELRAPRAAAPDSAAAAQASWAQQAAAAAAAAGEADAAPSSALLAMQLPLPSPSRLRAPDAAAAPRAARVLVLSGAPGGGGSPHAAFGGAVFSSADSSASASGDNLHLMLMQPPHPAQRGGGGGGGAPPAPAAAPPGGAAALLDPYGPPGLPAADGGGGDGVLLSLLHDSDAARSTAATAWLAAARAELSAREASGRVAAFAVGLGLSLQSPPPAAAPAAVELLPTASLCAFPSASPCNSGPAPFLLDMPAAAPHAHGCAPDSSAQLAWLAPVPPCAPLPAPMLAPRAPGCWAVPGCASTASP